MEIVFSNSLSFFGLGYLMWPQPLTLCSPSLSSPKKLPEPYSVTTEYKKPHISFLTKEFLIISTQEYRFSFQVAGQSISPSLQFGKPRAFSENPKYPAIMHFFGVCLSGCFFIQTNWYNIFWNTIQPKKLNWVFFWFFFPWSNILKAKQNTKVEKKFVCFPRDQHIYSETVRAVSCR